MSQTPPRISVLIPVYRDWPRLRLCLEALARQTWPREDFEIIAINNDVAPPPADFALPPGVRLLHEPRGHSYAARNAGLALARGEVLAFTDADCQPEPDWLAAGWAALQPEDVHLVGGRIGILIEQPGLVADYDRVFAFPQERYVSQGTSVTANLLVKRAVFEAIGPFNADLQSSGDFELCRRAGQAGYRLVYSAEAAVLHPARESVSALLRKNRRVAGGFRRREFELLGRGEREIWRNLPTMLRPRPRYWWRMLVGTDKTQNLPPLRRPGVVALSILLYYHFAISVLRKPPTKDQH